MLKSDVGIAVDGVMTQNSQYLPFFRLDPLNQEHVKETNEMRSALTDGQPKRPLLLFAGRFRTVPSPRPLATPAPFPRTTHAHTTHIRRSGSPFS